MENRPVVGDLKTESQNLDLATFVSSLNVEGLDLDLCEQLTAESLTRRLQDGNQQVLWLKTIIDQIEDYMFIKDRQSRFVIANKVVAGSLGIAHGDELLGKTDFDIHPADIAEGFFAEEQEIMSTGVALNSSEQFIIVPGGEKTWLSTSKVPLRDKCGNVIGVFGISRDINERKKADMLRDGQASILELIASGAPLRDVLKMLVLLIEDQLDGVKGSILLLDEDGRRLHDGASPSLPKAYCSQIDGVEVGPQVGSCGTAVHRRARVVVEDIATDPLWEDFAGLALEYGLRSCWSMPVVSPDGKILGTFALYSGNVCAPDDFEKRLMEDAIRIAAIAIEREYTEKKIRFLAEYDPVTGLANRNLLTAKLETVLNTSNHLKNGLSVAFFDLDKFKAVNDSLGHAAGDDLLRITAERVKSHLHPGDMVARFGGDEFVVLVSGSNGDLRKIEAILRRIQEAVAEPVVLEGQTLHVTSSMGVARYPNDGTSADTLLKNADAAMYRAKDLGRNNCQFYTSCMNDEAHNTLSLLQDMRVGIDEGHFVLEYQPQFDLRTMTVIGTEALVRWQHPVEGRLMPDKFIPLAEESGLIVPLGGWVLKEACRQGRLWQDLGHAPISVSVNVSVRQFMDPGLIGDVLDALIASGLAPGCLELELTESLLMQNPNQVTQVMNTLRSIGVRFALDDFGTGFSSLSALRTFPFCKLKIDRSFVRDMDENQTNIAIAKAIVTMGHDLSMRVIAEGVETVGQLEMLRDLGSNEAQGFYLGKPMTVSKFDALLSATSVDCPDVERLKAVS